MTHAGFWVDGAVRKPDRHHGDIEGDVLVRAKSNDVELFLETFSDVTSGYYWLDITLRESLTPAELYSVLKVLWPKCEAVFRPDDGAVVEWQVNNHSTENQAAIDWGNLTQYPPPVEPQWICITRENVKSYLFSECRFRNSTSHEWRTGVLCGWDDQDCCCLVNSDYVEEMPIMSWKYVEVQA